MIDIKLLRENPELIKENIKKKFQEEKLHLIDKARKKDIDWRNQKQRIDKLRNERNIISKEISKEKKEGKEVSKLMKAAKLIPTKIEEVEKKTDKLLEQLNSILIQIPNIISKKTPIGRGEAENKEVKKSGKVPTFDFKIKNHVELCEDLGLADFDSSSKVSGNGFYYLKGELALLNQALIRFAIDFMQSKGYTYIETPLMLREKQIFASMDKQAIEESVYSIKGEDLHLIGTAEQSLLAMHSGETFAFKDLPKKYFSYSMCFRKEIGSHGINEKGLWRTHQFNKIEQFVFCLPEDSEKIYDELLKNSEEILEKLNLPFRTIELCSGDLANWKHRSHDLEVWRPTLQEYGEVVSLSNCTDYQARKLGIKYIDKTNNRQVLHTLNDTALATSRILVAILENNQQKDGSIKIPEVLQKYMHNKKLIGRP
ncbi:MAG: serine--tRNA ligase [archaeon]